MTTQVPDKLLCLYLDVVSKIFFGSPARQHLLVDFVNTVLRLPEPITALQVLNPAVTPELVQQKGAVLDIRAITPHKTPIHIEMQAWPQASYLRRAQYYAALVYSSQLEKGTDYKRLRPSYSVHILNFRHFKGAFPDDYDRRLSVCDLRRQEEYPGLTHMHFIELPKFATFIRKNPAGSGHRHLDHWLQFLQNPTDQRMEEIMRIDPVIKDAMKHLIHISADEEAQELARVRERAEHELATFRKTDLRRGFKKGKAEGRAEGEAKGRAEGEAKGRAEGEAKGRAEGEARATYQLLRSLLTSPATSSLPDAEISALVGLPQEEVTVLRASLGARSGPAKS